MLMQNNPRKNPTQKSTLKKTSAQNRPRPQHLNKNRISMERSNASSRLLKASPFHLHFASTTDILYSPFQKNYYLPPHLNSSQMERNVFRAECSNWSVRPGSARKFDYDQLYAANQRRYENAGGAKEIRGEGPRVGRRWSQTKSKIKYLLEQDKATWQYFNGKKRFQKREPHPDDDLSQESSSAIST